MNKVLLSCLLAMLASCSNLASQPEQAQPQKQAYPKCPDVCAAEANASSRIPAGAPLPASETILEYAGRFSALAAEEQKKELLQVNENLKQNKLDFNYRMKAALIYALPGSRLRDNAKAQALLDNLLREPALDGERRTLAGLLRDYINENGKQASENSRLQQENAALAQKGREEQKRADSLQQTLNELKAIEKSMSGREHELNK